MNELDRRNHDLWKWGIIYVNPDDPSVWVEKHSGLGRTLNFAHPVSYLYIFLMLALPLALTAIFAF